MNDKKDKQLKIEQKKNIKGKLIEKNVKNIKLYIKMLKLRDL